MYEIVYCIFLKLQHFQNLLWSNILDEMFQLQCRRIYWGIDWEALLEGLQAVRCRKWSQPFYACNNRQHWSRQSLGWGCWVRPRPATAWWRKVCSLLSPLTVSMDFLWLPILRLSCSGWQKLREAAKGLREKKIWTRTKILSSYISYFVAILRFVAIYALFGGLCVFFWVKNSVSLARSTLLHSMYFIYITLN